MTNLQNVLIPSQMSNISQSIISYYVYKYPSKHINSNKIHNYKHITKKKIS